MNWFEADSDKLIGQAGEFPWLAEQAGSIHRELTAALSEAGPCWGADQVGQSFASVHVSPSDTTLGQLGSLPDQLDTTGTRFADTGAAYHSLDTADHFSAPDGS
jgi:hypothetical protein